MKIIKGHIIELVEDVEDVIAQPGNHDLKIRSDNLEIYIKYSVGRAWVSIVSNLRSRSYIVTPIPDLSFIERNLRNLEP